MPLYNKAETVRRAIRSIQHQSVTDWRLIVVDDGSTDQGPDIVAAIDDDRITIVRQENQGPGAARNRGIALAQSEFLSFLDADDEWYPWYLENSLRAITENDVALAGTHYYEWPKKNDMSKFWARRGVHCGRFSLVGNEDPGWAESLLLFFHVGNSLMKTQMACKFDGFYVGERCDSGEDTVFFIRIAINEDFMIIDPPAVIHHREDSSLSNRAELSLAPFCENPEVVLKYCPAHKRNLLRSVIARFALRSARNYARHGYKKRAMELLKSFPESRKFSGQYYRCRYEIILSRWFTYWIRFKCAVGPPVRLFIKSVAWKLHLLPKIPEIPTEKEDKYKNDK